MTQQQPPSEPRQHPCRCETCENDKTSEHSEEVIPGFVGKGSRYVDNGSVWCEIPNQYGEHWIDTFPYDERGCASHSANTGAQSPKHYTGACAIQDKCMDYADFVESIMDEIDNEDDDVPCPIKCEKRVDPRGGTDAQARIDAVVKELEAAKIKEIPYGDESAFNDGIDAAIALLKEGVGK